MQDHIVVSVLMLFVCTPSTLSGCPTECSCKDNKALCNITDILLQLDSNLQELRFVVDSIGTDVQSTWNFTRFGNLKSLTFSWTKPFTEKIVSVNPTRFTNADSFTGLTALRTLRINIPTTDIVPELLLGLSRLETIDLTNTAFLNTQKIVDVWQGSRLGEKPIRELILRKVIHTTSDLAFTPLVLADLFPLFANVSLELFDITDNGNVILYPGSLKYTPYLKVIRYSQNRLRYNDAISDCVIADLYLHQELREFDMSGIDHLRPIADWGRPVHSLPVSTMEGLGKCNYKPNCTVCSFYNAMCGQFVGKTPCDHLPKLEHLYQPDVNCTGNLRLIIPPKLEKLSFNNTVVGFFAEPDVTRGRTPPDHQIVCFQESNLKILDASHVTFPYQGEGIKTSIRGWEKLEEFRVESSDLVLLFSNFELLHDMPLLRIIKASGPKLNLFIASDHNSTIFSKSPMLEELHLRDSDIYQLNADHFTALHNLATLNLAGNRLTTFDANIMNLTKLKLLNLSGNALEYLSGDTRDSLDYVARLRGEDGERLAVDISDNDLSCTCSNIAFVSWIQQTTVYLVGNHTYLCHHPVQGGKVQLSTVVIEDLRAFCFPRPNYGLFIAVGTVPVALLILLLLGVLVYRKRWKIRYFLYALRHSSKLLHEIRGQFTYDGFVVYNEVDRKWVHEQMLDKMEKDYGLKLCVHYRDFIPGHNIEDQIVQSISVSRKTVLVLTPNFLNSHWCDFEMQMARNRLFSEGNDVLVLVILRPFPISQMNKTLKHLLDKKTYLEWHSSSDGQELFWKQLKLALSPAGVTVSSLTTCQDQAATSQQTVHFSEDDTQAGSEQMSNSTHGTHGKPPPQRFTGARAARGQLTGKHHAVEMGVQNRGFVGHDY